MSYAELKKFFDTARREQLSADKELRRINSELENISGIYKELDQKFASMEAEDVEVSKQRYRDSIVLKLENDLHNAEQSLKKLKAEYEGVRGSITYDTVAEQCSTKQEILNEVKHSSSVLKTKLEELVGCRFYKELMLDIETQELDFDDRNIDRLIEYFNSSESLIETYANSDRKIGSVMSAVDQYLINGDGDATSERIRLVGAVTVVVLLLFFGKIFLPVTVLAFVVLCMYNVVKNYRVFRVFIVQKAVQDNIEKIDEHLRSQIQDEVNRQLGEVDNDYLHAIESLEQKVKQLSDEVTAGYARAEETFQYDGSRMRRRKQAEIEKLDKQRSALLVQQTQQKEILDSKTKVVTELSSQLSGILKQLHTEYLTGVGKDVIFKPDFLFDIDSVKNKPVFFKHPQVSTLFLYDDLHDVYDFVRLVSVQLRAKLNPFNLTIEVMDEKNMGQELIYFTAPRDDEAVASLYSIVTDAEGVKNLTVQTATDLLRRQDNIRREFGNIKEYNTKMIELNSLTEAYDFQFAIDPSQNFISDSRVEQTLRIGGELGIFLHLFISKDEFSSLKEYAFSLLDVVGKVYFFKDGGYFERAKDFVAENLLCEQE